MSCDVCADGWVVVEWTDAPHDFAVCLCPAGEAWRVAMNHGTPTVPRWRVWCAQWQVDPARVFMVEDVWTAEELAAVGLGVEPVAPITREAALLAASKRAKR